MTLKIGLGISIEYIAISHVWSDKWFYKNDKNENNIKIKSEVFIVLKKYNGT